MPKNQCVMAHLVIARAGAIACGHNYSLLVSDLQ